jgi:hypothetical protein
VTQLTAPLTEEQLRLGYRQTRTHRWPETFEQAMADPLCRRLIEGAALRLSRGAWLAHPGHRTRLPQAPIPPNPTARHRAVNLGRFDAKRAAANDKD